MRVFKNRKKAIIITENGSNKTYRVPKQYLTEKEQEAGDVYVDYVGGIYTGWRGKIRAALIKYKEQGKFMGRNNAAPWGVIGRESGVEDDANWTKHRFVAKLLRKEGRLALVWNSVGVFIAVEPKEFVGSINHLRRSKGGMDRAITDLRKMQKQFPHLILTADIADAEGVN